MLPYLGLMKMVELVDPVPTSDVVVGFNLKMMRIDLKLPKGDLECMHPVLKCVGVLNNKSVSQL